jgi:hypothetical protein
MEQVLSAPEEMVLSVLLELIMRGFFTEIQTKLKKCAICKDFTTSKTSFVYSSAKNPRISSTA